MRTVTAGGMDWNLVDYGKGPPLLFVHGFPLDHTMWNGQLDAFGAKYRVIAPDLRGFGCSTVTEGIVRMEDFADDLESLLKLLVGSQQVVLCGLSMGGYIALQFARKYPRRLRGLVLCDTKAAADTEAAKENRAKVARQVLESGAGILAKTMMTKLFSPNMHRSHPGIVQSTQTVIMNSDPDGIAAAQFGMRDRPDATEWLEDIVLPTLLVVGADDAITPVAEMEKMLKGLPKAKLVVVPDAGHMAPLENPVFVNGAMDEYLESLAP